MESLDTFTETTGATGVFPGFIFFMAVFMALMLVDVALKAWAMWRAAKMDMRWWFVILLLVNSLGIFPFLFLACTKNRYRKLILPVCVIN